MRINFSPFSLPSKGPIVVGVLKGGKLTKSAERLNKITNGTLGHAMEASRFQGKPGQCLTVVSPVGLEEGRVVLLGLGDGSNIDELEAQRLGGCVYKEVANTGDASVMLAIDSIEASPLSITEMSANFAYGALLGSYRFDKYRTQQKPDATPTIRKFIIACRNTAPAKTIFSSLSKVAEGVFFTRDLVSEPANIIYPASLAQQAKSLAKLNVKVQVLDEKQMANLNMGALLGVAQGSAKKPRLVVMQWSGAPRVKEKAPIAFIGKGVTFDTGGISIKPAGGMEDMKWDMAGSGVVIGLMKALAGRKAKVNAVGVVGLVENMPSSTAQRPGDVVQTMSGQTVEVINTDAEGRLVLADAMWYCQTRYKPHTMIDLATLTGAIIVSLGNEHAGLFSNDEELSNRLATAGKAVGETVWRMPLGPAYDKLINSDIADMKNVGGRWGGSITAAQFLNRYVKTGVKWAHLDIAGVTWSKKGTPTVPKGGTGFGVRLLDQLVRENYES